jgi:hypothetical protein
LAIEKFLTGFAASHHERDLLEAFPKNDSET